MLRSSPATVMLSVLLVGFGPPSFRGCGEEGTDPPDPPAPLPVVDGGRCFRDEQCPNDDCMEQRCLAGTCVAVGPLVDADGDNHAPPPCGDDCDDSRFDVFGGAPESCDDRDNDCDLEVDEGAPLVQETFTIGAGDSTSLVVSWDDGLLVTELGADSLWGLPLTSDGTVGAAVPLLSGTVGVRFQNVAGAAADDGTVAFVAVDDVGEAHWVVLDPSGGVMPTIVEGPGTFSVDGPIGNLEAVAHAGGFAVAYDTPTAVVPLRVVHPTLTAAPTDIGLLGLGTASFGFASDGTRLAVADDVDSVFFVDPDGTRAETHPIGNITARRALASASGSIIALVRDDFDERLGRVTAAGGLGETFPAPSGAPEDEVRVVAAGELVFVGRTNAVDTSVSTLKDDLATYEGSTLSFGRPDARVTRLSVAQTTGGYAIVGALERDGIEVGLLLACE